MKKIAWMIVAAALFVGCKGKGVQQAQGDGEADSTAAITVKYATGFSVKDSAGVRLVDIGGHTDHRSHEPDHHPDVLEGEHQAEVHVPEGRA